MKRYVVTGGAGFIGSHLVKRLISDGHKVTVIDDLSTGKIGNLPHSCLFVKGSILDDHALSRCLDEVDGVFHLAAVVSVDICNGDLMRGNNVNLVGSVNVFRIAAERNIPVVYASSAAVYGDTSGGICYEDLLPRPQSPYGAGKFGCELYASVLSNTHNLDTIGLRFFNVYGSGQDPSSPYSGVVSKFVECARNGGEFLIYGDGQQSRDFVFVLDVVQAMTSAMAVLLDKGNQKISEVINVCTGRSINLLELVRILSELVNGTRSSVVFHKPKTGDIRYSVGDCSRMRARLSLLSTITVEVGLETILNCVGDV